MKTKLGLLGTLICSAGLLALPAAAQDWNGHRNDNGLNSTASVQQRGNRYDSQRAVETRNVGRNYASYSNDEWRGDDHGRRSDRERFEHRHIRDNDRDWR